MHNNYTPNTFAPLRPITPARVAVWPPKSSMCEQSYGQSNGGGSSVTVGTMVIMAIIVAVCIGLLIWLSRGYFHAGFDKKPPVVPSGAPTKSPQSVVVQQ